MGHARRTGGRDHVADGDHHGPRTPASERSQSTPRTRSGRAALRRVAATRKRRNAKGPLLRGRSAGDECVGIEKALTWSVAPPASSPLQPTRIEADGRVLINGVPWETYVAIRDMLDDAGSRVRLTYLEGALEIMSPGPRHESVKKLLARLLEAWADEAGIDLEGIGSTTFRNKARERGLKPDECYCLDEPVRGRPRLSRRAATAPLRPSWKALK